MMFSSSLPSLDIFEVPRRQLIEEDEFESTLEKCNRKRRWAVMVLCHIQKVLHYHNGQR
jgi:hypothetical protein